MDQHGSIPHIARRTAPFLKDWKPYERSDDGCNHNCPFKRPEFGAGNTPGLSAVDWSGQTLAADTTGPMGGAFMDFRLSLGPSFAPSRIFLACLRCEKKLSHRAIQGYPRKLRCLSIPSFLILRLPNLLLKGMVTGQILRRRVPMDTTDFGNLSFPVIHNIATREVKWVILPLYLATFHPFWIWSFGISPDFLVHPLPRCQLNGSGGERPGPQHLRGGGQLSWDHLFLESKGNNSWLKHVDVVFPLKFCLQSNEIWRNERTQYPIPRTFGDFWNTVPGHGSQAPLRGPVSSQLGSCLGRAPGESIEPFGGWGDGAER